MHDLQRGQRGKRCIGGALHHTLPIQDQGKVGSCSGLSENHPLQAGASHRLSGNARHIVSQELPPKGLRVPDETGTCRPRFECCLHASWLPSPTSAHMPNTLHQITTADQAASLLLLRDRLPTNLRSSRTMSHTLLRSRGTAATGRFVDASRAWLRRHNERARISRPRQPTCSEHPVLRRVIGCLMAILLGPSTAISFFILVSMHCWTLLKPARHQSCKAPHSNTVRFPPFAGIRSGHDKGGQQLGAGQWGEHTGGRPRSRRPHLRRGYGHSRGDQCCSCGNKGGIVSARHKSVTRTHDSIDKPVWRNQSEVHLWRFAFSGALN